MILKKILLGFPAVFVLLAITPVPANGKTVKPKWVKDVGAHIFPNGPTIFMVNNFGAKNDGVTLATQGIQKAIDSCASAGGGIVSFEPGEYLTGSLFLKKGVHLRIDKEVKILGSSNITDYPEIETRVAGIEMEWPAALINVLNQDNVAVTGEGTIDAQGKPFWDRYWEMRKDYESKGLRWIVDYDCKRPRSMLVSSSTNVTLQGITLKRAGFWTVQILYSQFVTVNGLTVRNNEGGHGPSTDGIDIDSSSKILVENCDVDCNDDNYCLKAGRDADGLRVNRPCEFIVLRNCIARAGGGIVTCGSETSGNIRHVWVENMTGYGTKAGVRVKSAITRGGIVEDIYINNLTMEGVVVPIDITTNWNPSYSYSELPKGYSYDSIPKRWKALLQKVEPPAKGIPVFRNIFVDGLKATGAKKAVNGLGLKESVIDRFSLTNVSIAAETAGEIKFCRNWKFDKVSISAADGSKVKMENCDTMKLE